MFFSFPVLFYSTFVFSLQLKIRFFIFIYFASHVITIRSECGMSVKSSFRSDVEFRATGTCGILIRSGTGICMDINKKFRRSAFSLFLREFMASSCRGCLWFLKNA